MTGVKALVIISSMLWLSPPQRGIYLSAPGVANSHTLRVVVEWVDKGVLNCVVIDFKNDKGFVCYPSRDSLVKSIGGVSPFIKKPQHLIEQLHKKGVYVIARIVLFKDSILAHYNEGIYALKEDNGIYRDDNGVFWTDPTSPFVHSYNIAIAREVAGFGVDEIQFDYIRFPSCAGWHTQQPLIVSKTDVLCNFLERAYNELSPMGVRLSIDLYGWAAWWDSLPQEGQSIAEMGKFVDAIYPMLYPSHFGNNFLLKETKEQRTHDIISQGVKQAKRKTPSKRIVAFIQGFPWKRSTLGEHFIAHQLEGASKAAGWIVWHAGCDYSETFSTFDSLLAEP